MIGILVALGSEAGPIIRELSLEKDENASKRIYVGESVVLAVSGIGQEAAASATRDLLTRLERPGLERVENVALLNVGLAGHRSEPLGRAFRAGVIENAATGTAWRSHPLAGCDLPVARVRTVEVPETEYRDDVLYDMEAAAFWETASEHPLSPELQVVKVISDNRESTVSELTRERAAELMTAAMPSITTVVYLIDRVL